MRGTIIIAGAVLVLAIGLLPSARAQQPPVDPKAKQFKVQGKFTENLSDNGGKDEKTTRVPALFIVEGRRLVFRSGGAVGVTTDPAVGAVPASPYGLSLQLTVTRLGSDDLLLDLAVDNTQLVGDPNKVAAAKSASVHGTRKAKLGRNLRIVLEEDAKGAPRQWLDLTVIEADE
jgi:hypothetical protein